MRVNAKHRERHTYLKEHMVDCVFEILPVELRNFSLLDRRNSMMRPKMRSPQGDKQLMIIEIFLGELLSSECNTKDTTPNYREEQIINDLEMIQVDKLHRREQNQYLMHQQLIITTFD